MPRPLLLLTVVGVLIFGTVHSSISAQSRGGWKMTEQVDTARSLHTATYIDGPQCTGPQAPANCGQVIVTGGQEGGLASDPVNSASFYDPLADKWTTLNGRMQRRRAWHQAILLNPRRCESAEGAANYPCGKLLVAGGKPDASSADVTLMGYGTSEIYDFETGGWGNLEPLIQTGSGSNPNPAGAGNAGFYKHHLALIQDDSCTPVSDNARCGRVLAAGTWGSQAGFTGAGWEETRIFTPNSRAGGRWAIGPNLLADHGYSGGLIPLDGPACRRGDPPNYCGVLLIAGGADRAALAQTVSELFIPEDDTWKLTGPLAHARIGHTMTLLDGGECHSSWAPDYCGKVLAAGGLEPTAELYDPATGTWAPTAPMRKARLNPTATLLDGPACYAPDPPSYCGNVLVAGGAEPSSEIPKDWAEIFDPDGNGGAGSWTEVPMLQARSNLAAAPIGDGRVLVAGGEPAPEAAKTAEIFTPKTLPTLSVSIQNASASEAERALKLDVVLARSCGSVGCSPDTAETVSVEFSTADGTATGSDYTSTAGRIVFAPGENSKSIPIEVRDDGVVEADETVIVNLSRPMRLGVNLGELGLSDGIRVLNGRGVGTILNDDKLPPLPEELPVDKPPADEKFDPPPDGTAIPGPGGDTLLAAPPSGSALAPGPASVPASAPLPGSAPGPSVSSAPGSAPGSAPQAASPQISAGGAAVPEASAVSGPAGAAWAEGQEAPKPGVQYLMVGQNRGAAQTGMMGAGASVLILGIAAAFLWGSRPSERRAPSPATGVCGCRIR